MHWKDWCWRQNSICCPPDVKNWLFGKDLDAGKDWWQEEKGMTEDDMVGWHCQLNRHEFEQAPGGGDGQGILVYCRPWVTKSQTLLRKYWEVDWEVESVGLCHMTSTLDLICCNGSLCSFLNWRINDCSIAQLSLNLCNLCSNFAHHFVSDAIQPSHPLLSPSPPAFNLSQHQGLF